MSPTKVSKRKQVKVHTTEAVTDEQPLSLPQIVWDELHPDEVKSLVQLAHSYNFDLCEEDFETADDLSFALNSLLGSAALLKPETVQIGFFMDDLNRMHKITTPSSLAPGGFENIQTALMTIKSMKEAEANGPKISTGDKGCQTSQETLTEGILSKVTEHLSVLSGQISNFEDQPLKQLLDESNQPLSMLNYLEVTLDWLKDKMMAAVAEEPLKLTEILSDID